MHISFFLFSDLTKFKNHSLKGLTWQVFSYHHLLLMILWLITKVMTCPWVTRRRMCVITEQDFLGGQKSMMHIYELKYRTFRHLKKIIRSTHYYPALLPQGTLISNNKTLTCYFLKIEIPFFYKCNYGLNFEWSVFRTYAPKLMQRTLRKSFLCYRNRKSISKPLRDMSRYSCV